MNAIKNVLIVCLQIFVYVHNAGLHTVSLVQTSILQQELLAIHVAQSKKVRVRVCGVILFKIYYNYLVYDLVILPAFLCELRI